MERIGGVDVARGLAVLGMMSAHVGVAADDLWSTDGWLGIADGRSAALFGVLAGLSIALLSGGTMPPSGERLRFARVRIAVRGVLVFGIGAVLMALGTPIAVILPVYGLLFVLALPVLRLPPRALAALAAAVAIAGPPLCFGLEDALTAAGGPPAGLLEYLIAGYYPAAIWLAYVLAGLAVGRSDLRSPAVRRRLLALGVLLAVLGYGGGLLATGLAAGSPESTLRLLDTEPHADSTVEVTGNIGVALVVIALCLVLADRWPRPVLPIASTGALALTAYTVHIVVIAVLGPEVVREPEVDVHLRFLVVTVVLCTLWRLLWRRGPLEWAMHEISTRVAASVLDGGTAGGTPGGTRPPGGVDALPTASPQGQTRPRSQPAPPRR